MGNNVVENFKSVYKELDANNVDILKDIYRENIVFVDPFHEIKGISNLANYFINLYKNIDSCQFDFDEPYLKPDSAMIPWSMSFLHASISKEPITVNGCTHIYFDEKIYFHRDYFDAGQMIYERLPVIRSAIKLIKKRMNEQ